MKENEKAEMKEEHPDIVDLELYRTGEAKFELSEHIESCLDCQAEIEFLNGLSSDMSGENQNPDFSQLDQNIEADIKDIKLPKRMDSKGVLLLVIKIAALVCLVFYFVQLHHSVDDEKQGLAVEGGASPGDEKLMLGDINADGIVDVIDNYLFAKRLQDEDDIAEHMDVNQDGHVDIIDLEALSNQIVALGGDG